MIIVGSLNQREPQADELLVVKYRIREDKLRIALSCATCLLCLSQGHFVDFFIETKMMKFS
jgi:hypothetical protein